MELALTELRKDYFQDLNFDCLASTTLLPLNSSSDTYFLNYQKLQTKLEQFSYFEYSVLDFFLIYSFEFLGYQFKFFY